MAAEKLNLRHLEAFCAAIRTGAVTAAARSSNLTQPAISLALAKLERIAGTRLFDRGPRGIRPTPAGAQFAETVGHALAGLNRVASELLPALGRPISRVATMPQLAALTHLDRAGSFAVAGRASGLMPSTIYRAVRGLEMRLDTALAVPAGRNVRMTETGSELAKAVRLMSSVVLEALADAGDGGRVRGRLLIGAMPLARVGVLPIALNALCKTHPEIECQVIEGSHSDLVRLLLQGAIDIFVGALRGEEMPGLAESHLFDDELVVVARADHPLLGRSGCEIDLAAYPWVTSPSGTPRRRIWERMFELRGFEPPPPRVECSSASVVRNLLLHGDWLAVLSPDQFHRERRLGLLAIVDGILPRSTRPIGLTVRADWTPGRAQAEFILRMRMAASSGSADEI